MDHKHYYIKQGFYENIHNLEFHFKEKRRFDFFKIIKIKATKIVEFYKSRNINSLVVFFILIYIIFLIKLVTVEELGNGLFFGIYSIMVSLYILSRFAIAHLYKPHDDKFSREFQPTVSFGIPSKNEGGGL